MYYILVSWLKKKPILIIYVCSRYSKVLSIKLSLSSYYLVLAYMLISKDHIVEMVPLNMNCIYFGSAIHLKKKMVSYNNTYCFVIF